MVKRGNSSIARSGDENKRTDTLRPACDHGSGSSGADGRNPFQNAQSLGMFKGERKGIRMGPN